MSSIVLSKDSDQISIAVQMSRKATPRRIAAALGVNPATVRYKNNTFYLDVHELGKLSVETS